MLRAVAPRLGQQLDQLIVSTAEAATRHLARRMRAPQERRVDQQRALVVGDHGRRLATLPQQLAGTADGRGLAAAQEPTNQMNRHGSMVSTVTRIGDQGQYNFGHAVIERVDG